MNPNKICQIKDSGLSKI